MSKNPYVFIVGTPRSGTTLLKRIVDAHPSIAITRETHWISRYYKRSTNITEDGMVTPGIVDELCAYKRFAHLSIKREKLEKLVSTAGNTSYSELVSGIFDLYAKREGKPLAGDKTPPYVRNITMLHQLFPKARFVHLIRDGRDVCLSMLTWRMAAKAAGARVGWDKDPVVTTALWWKWLVQLGRETGSALGPQLYHEVRYEDLVVNPSDEAEKICAFLDLPFDPAMLRYNEGRVRDEPGISANSAWLPPTPGLRDWRTQMKPNDIERFEAAAGDLLTDMRYERRVSSFSDETNELTSTMRDCFDGRPLPNNW